MARNIVFVLAALCLAQVAFAEKAAEPVKIEEVIAKAQNALGQMSAEVQKALGIKEMPDVQQIAQTIMTQTQTLAGRVISIVGDLQKEIAANPDINSVVSAVAKRLNQTAQDLQKQAPEMQAKASDLQAQLKTGMETLLSESQKLVGSFSGEATVIQKEMNKITQNAMDSIIESATKVQEQLKKAIETPSANV